MSSKASTSGCPVRERFAKARRDGYATWLWPDIPLQDWRSAVDAIAHIARNVLAAHKTPFLRCRDADAMGVAGYTSGMGPLLGFWIETGAIGAETEIAGLFRIHLSHNRRRMERLLRIAREVTCRLNEAGIAPVILKGMHTAFRYFPEPATRPLSDIDLFIPMPAMDAAERVFSALGYRQVVRTRSPYACDWMPPARPRLPHTLTFVHEDDPWSIDVLGTLDRRLATGKRVTFSSLLPCTESADWFAGAAARVMQQPLLALYLAAHLSQTLLNVTVLRVLELALVIRRDSAEGRFDWGEFLRGASLIGGLRFVYPALAFADQLAPEIVPPHVMARVAADAPTNLRQVIERLTIAAAQPLKRHSVSERFMWAATPREGLRQIASEFFLDGQGRPVGDSLYRLGSKLWAFGRGRYSP